MKKESESESEESVKPEIKKNKWAKHLKDDGDFAGWKKTAYSVLKAKEGKMK